MNRAVHEKKTKTKTKHISNKMKITINERNGIKILRGKFNKVIYQRNTLAKKYANISVIILGIKMNK